MEKGGKTYWIVSDHLGSVRMVVDASTGEIAQRMDYDASGYVIRDTIRGSSRSDLRAEPTLVSLLRRAGGISGAAVSSATGIIGT